MNKPVNYLNLSIAVFIIAFLFFYAIQLVVAGLIFLRGGKEPPKENWDLWNNVVNIAHDGVQDLGRGIGWAWDKTAGQIPAVTGIWHDQRAAATRIAIQECQRVYREGTMERAACDTTDWLATCNVLDGNALDALAATERHICSQVLNRMLLGGFP